MFDVHAPIPTLSAIGGWKSIPIRESGDPLVPIGPGSEYEDLRTDSIYFGERDDSPYACGELVGSLLTQFVRKSAADALRIAQSYLPSPYTLVIFDAYRTLEVQRALYDQYFVQLRALHPDWNDSQLSEETQTYVSLPSNDPARPSPHNTGGAIDLAIAHGDTLLDFGTPYDHGGPEAALRYLEELSERQSLTSTEHECLENRRLLYSVMTRAGFEPYPDEWWHYNTSGTQMGARMAGRQEAVCGAVRLSEAHLAHEARRKEAYFAGLKRFERGETQENPRSSKFQRAARIAPA